MKDCKSTVMITGVTRGIGKSTAEKYLERGFSVLGIYKERKDLAQKLESLHRNIKTFQINLNEINEIPSLIKKIKQITPKIDILINNAGIYTGGGIEELTGEQIHEIFNVNVSSKLLLIKEAIPLLTKSKNPKIVNISSRYGFLGHAEASSLAYNITNSSIIMMTIAAQQEFKSKNISIGCFIPTVTATDRFYSAFSAEEQKEVYNAGILAQKNDTSEKLVKYIEDMKGEEIIIDKRANSGHLNCLNLQTI